MKWGVTKVKYPNKGQKPMYQGVRYSESLLYLFFGKCAFLVEICMCPSK